MDRKRLNPFVPCRPRSNPTDCPGEIRYLITGLIGAFVGGFLFKAVCINIDLGNAYVNEIVVAAIGAVVIVLLARLIA